MNNNRRQSTRTRISRAMRVAGLVSTGLIAAAAAAHVWMEQRYSRELERHIRQLEREGIPVTAEQLAGNSLYEDRNQATAVLRALPPESPKSRPDLEAVLERMLATPVKRPASKDIKELRRLLTGELSPTMRQLHRAAALTEARYPLASGSLDVDGRAAASATLAGRLLTAEGVVLHAAGDGQQAAASFEAALRIARSLRIQKDRSCWIAAWPAVNFALAGIQTAHAIRPLDADEAALLDRALASLDWMAGSRNVLDSHTVVVVSEARRWRRDRSLRGVIWRPYAAAMHLRLLELLETARGLADEPWRHWPAAVRNPVQTNWLAPGRSLVEITRPALTGPFWQRDAIIACCSAMRLSLALEAHRRRNGEYPRTLDALQMPTGGSLPPDPFSGEPFRYTRTRNGYLFYSIGPDLRDDQGRTRKKTKQLTEEGDLVWDARSWLPRQPE
ncbi:MAG: hypothetical protein KatS3mg024_2745 [Armatimonadota bacterium]|nr:MAG: hypothetical protein KatS3mg024_2745 [Armatimonadota bacterium]